MGWQWRYVLFFTVSSALIVAGVKLAPASYQQHLGLPGLPLGVLGGAIGIFTSFRTNSAYDRWWEGRKLWGALVNNSRHWASQVLTYASPGEKPPTDLQTRLVLRLHRRTPHPRLQPAPPARHGQRDGLGHHPDEPPRLHRLLAH